MEIISYVGFNNNNFNSGLDTKARRFTAWLSEKNKILKNRKKRPVVKTSFSNYSKESVIASRPAKVSFNFKKILLGAGEIVNFLQKHAVKLLIILAGITSFFLSSWALTQIFTYHKEHTNPLTLQNEETEKELLDSLMKAFAKEETPDYLADGTLLNADITTDISKLISEPVTFQTYKVKSGDTISGITRKFGLKNISTIIGINNIENVRLLTAGTKLQIPSIDGLTYTVQKGNTLQGLSAKYNVSMEELLDVNELESAELQVGQKLFIPVARMNGDDLLNALGELYKLPILSKFRYTSMFGPRIDPISGAKSNHTGVDMACPTGTPIYSSSAGTVAFVGYSNIFGNYVIIKHSKGYQTLYGHMSKIIAKKGQIVSQGTKIGLVGSTGYSTGPHLHFTVYRNGKLVDPMTIITK